MTYSQTIAIHETGAIAGRRVLTDNGIRLEDYALLSPIAAQDEILVVPVEMRNDLLMVIRDIGRRIRTHTAQESYCRKRYFFTKHNFYVVRQLFQTFLTCHIFLFTHAKLAGLRGDVL